MAQDVDFVVGDDARPAAPAPSPPRDRVRIVLLGVIALGVLLAAGLTVDTLRHRSPTPTSSTPAPTQVSSGVPLAATGCPAYTACLTTTVLPGAVTTAVRRVFTRAALRYSRTLTSRRDNAPADQLRQRTAVFVAGRTTIAVLITLPGAQPDAAGAPNRTRTVIRTTDDGVYVTVRAIAAATADLPSYERLQRLVADPRLLAL